MVLVLAVPRSPITKIIGKLAMPAPALDCARRALASRMRGSVSFEPGSAELDPPPLALRRPWAFRLEVIKQGKGRKA